MNNQITYFQWCGILPPSFGCHPNANAQTIGNTGWLTCGQPLTVTTTVQPTHVNPCVGPTGTQGCTSALGCPSTSTCPPNANAQTIGNTGWLTCGQPSTLTTTIQPTTFFTLVPGSCGVLPPSVGCPPNANAQTIGNTGWLTCGQPSTVTTTVQPTHVNPCVGPTGTQGCTSALGCPSTSTCPPDASAQTIGVTGWLTCGQITHPGTCYGPTGTQGCTSGLGCPSTSTCPPNANAQAQFPTLSCTIPAVCLVTAIAHCSGAQAQTIGNTGWLTCGQPSTVTTTVQPTHVNPCVGPTGTQGCTSALGCPSTSTCPPNTIAQTIGHTGWLTCGQITHPGTCYGPTGTQGCTSGLGCPSTSTCPPNANAQAQFPTVSCTVPAVCAVTQIIGCGGSGFPTQHCTGIPFVC